MDDRVPDRHYRLFADYEWKHYVAHRPIRPMASWGRWIKKVHLWHHYKNERYWYGVTHQVLDRALGTWADEEKVDKSETAATLNGKLAARPYRCNTRRQQAMAPTPIYENIAEKLRQEGYAVESGQMFGKLCLKAEGKAFAAYYQDEMVFKLTGDSHPNALGLDGAKLWDPSGKHRPMKDWVQVPAAYAERWLELAMQALGK